MYDRHLKIKQEAKLIIVATMDMMHGPSVSHQHI